MLLESTNSPMARVDLREQRQKASGSSDPLELASIGVLHLLNGEYQQSVDLCERALDLDPKLLPALTCRGYARLPLATKDKVDRNEMANVLSDVHSALAVDSSCEPSHNLLRDIVNELRSAPSLPSGSPKASVSVTEATHVAHRP